MVRSRVISEKVSQGKLQNPMAVLGLGLCLLTFTFGIAAEIDDLIANAPGPEDYPEAPALILLDRQIVTIDKSNTATTERYLVVKIFADRGRDEFGEITQRYNRNGQVCEVLEARTHKVDRSVVRPEKKAIADVSAPEVADDPAYTSAMLKVVSFPALEKNAVIEYRARVRQRKPGREDWFSGSVLFGGYTPALRREFRLVLPRNSKFRYAWNNTSEPVAPVVETLGNTISYTWTMTNTPQVFREPGMPDLARLVPVLYYSSCEGWAQVAVKLKQEFEKGLESTGEIRRLADSLAAGKSRSAAIRDIFLYVTQRIRNVPLGYGRVGYDTRKASQILKWRYGDCRDKNCLLVSLLRQIGVYAFAAVLARGAPPNDSVPSADVFDWLVTVVPTDSANFEFSSPKTFQILDPFAEYYSYGNLPESDAKVSALCLHGRCAGLAFTPSFTSSLCSTFAEIVLEPDGTIWGNVSTEASGYYDSRLREEWRNQTPTDRKRSLAQIASSIKPGAEVDTFWFADLHNLTAPAACGFRFRASRYAVTQKSEISLLVPTPALVEEPLFGITTSVRRENPVETRPPRTYQYRCHIKLPAGYRPDILPDSLFVSGNGVEVRAGWAKTDVGVAFFYTLRIDKADFSLGEYAGLKAAVDAVLRPQLRGVYFLR